MGRTVQAEAAGSVPDRRWQPVAECLRLVRQRLCFPTRYPSCRLRHDRCVEDIVDPRDVPGAQAVGQHDASLKQELAP